MHTTRTSTDQRESNQLALIRLRLVLACVFIACGGGMLVSPFIGGTRSGQWWTFDAIAGISHLVVGAVLLNSRFASGAAMFWGPLVIWTTVSWLPTPESYAAVGPSLVTIALLLLALCCWLWHRADVATWHTVLDRFVSRQVNRQASDANFCSSRSAAVKN